jgi:four helix bundle protein
MNLQHGYVRHFTELEVYKRQRSLAKDVFALTSAFPREERFSLISQIRRSSRSIGAQIAESWAKRLYPKHFVSKLTDADGEQLETQRWANEAADCGYITVEEHTRVRGLCEEIGRMLGSMIRKAESFASADYSLQEEQALYLTNCLEPTSSLLARDDN